MSTIDRRDFVKSISVAVGAAAFAGITPAVSAQNQTAGTKKASTNMYEVFALRYSGPFDRKLAMLLFNTGWAEDMQIYYYTWVIRNKNNGEATLVDTGTGRNLAKLKNFPGFVPPENLVANLGIKPEQVTKVIITHMHFDHVGGMEDIPQAFPKAKFYVQKKEFDFWCVSPLSQRAPYKGLQWPAGNKVVADLAKTPRLVIVEGDTALDHDMELLLTPGHTPGLQSVFVPTAKGPTIVASDSAHLARSFKEDVPSGLITDLPTWLVSYDKLRAKAPIENMFPGHDAIMGTGYPKIAENITQLA